MKVRTLWTAPSHVAMVGFAALFVSYADLFLEHRGMLPVPVLAVYLLLIALALLSAPIFLRAAADARARARLIWAYRAHLPVLMPLASLVVLAFISAIRGTANMTEGPRLVLYPAYWMVVTLLSMLLPLPEHRGKGFRWYLLAGFALAAASVLVDAAHPGTFSWQTDRAAGFAVNPNTAGFLLVALCSSIISFDRVRLLDVMVLVVTAACVLATLSRGAAGMLACVVVFYGAAAVRYGWRRRVRFLVAGSAALVLLIGGAYVATKVLLDQKMFGTSGESARQRMLTGQEPIIRRDESRIVVAEHAWDLIRESPLMGYGSGFTYTLPIGPHNIYLSRWLDLGLPGILAVLWLLAAMALTFSRRRYANGVVFTAVVALEGFVSHNLLEERIFFVLLGVLLTCSVRDSPEPVAQALPSGLPVWRPPARAPRGLDGVVIRR